MEDLCTELIQKIFFYCKEKDKLNLIMVNKRFFNILSNEKIDMCVLAVKHNNLDSLKHLHTNGYKWDKHTCIMAVKNGNFECLEYAIDHGCPWDNDKTIHFTLKNNCFKSLTNFVNKLKHHHTN
jgi:hypothetical protein